MVAAIRHHRPKISLVLLGPCPWRSDAYQSNRHYASSVAAAYAYSRNNDLALVDLQPLVSPMHAEGRGNPDGLHWDWTTHAQVGHAVAEVLAADE
jgi:hypothetical protein